MRFDECALLRWVGTSALLAVTVSIPWQSLHAKQTVPATVQAILVLRSLGYDRTLKDRVAGGTVVIGILHKPELAASAGCEREITGALIAGAKETTVSGFPVKVAAVAVPKTGDVVGELKRVGTQAVYLCTGLDADVGRITAATRGAATLSFSASEDYVKNGVAIGFAVRGDRPAILVNVAAAHAEGANLASTFLRIAEIVR